MSAQVPEMSPRERWVAAVKLQPVDRLPFWPKLGGSYPRAQDSPFNNMNCGEIHNWIGSDKHSHVPSVVKETRKTTSFESVKENGRLRNIITTPYGKMETHQRWHEDSQSWHPVKFPVENAEHIKWMIEYYRDCRLDLDPEGLEKAKAAEQEIGSDAIIGAGIGESPLMHWVEWLAGIENAHFFLADHRDEVEELFGVIHEHLVRRAEIISDHSPADILYMVENTSTTLISPEQYRRYCFEHIMQYGTIGRNAGRLVVLHMCGHLKKLLPDLARLPVAAFEAYTSPTLGDTTLLDGRTACPDKCLIGGTNAMLWLRPAEEIISKIEADLSVLPHHRGIVVTSAGVMPPGCKPETIKAVCDWVKQYDARMN